MYRLLMIAGSLLPLLRAAPARSQETNSADARPTQAFRVLVMPDELQENLGKLAARAKRETVRCLIGVVVADTAFVEMAWEPAIRESDASSVSYGGCPLASIAKWHNHLARFAPTPADACYLSDTDVADALVPGAPRLQIVQVNKTVMCWWTRGQVAAARPGEFLGPISEQLSETRPAFASRAPSQ